MQHDAKQYAGILDEGTRQIAQKSVQYTASLSGSILEHGGRAHGGREGVADFAYGLFTCHLFCWIALFAMDRQITCKELLETYDTKTQCNCADLSSTLQTALLLLCQ